MTLNGRRLETPAIFHTPGYYNATWPGTSTFPAPDAANVCKLFP